MGLEIPEAAATTPPPLTITAPGPDEITEIVTQLLAAGKDPGTDKTVQALVTRAYLANLPGVTEALEAKRDQEVLAVFLEAAPSINNQLAEMFAADAETLERHKDTVGAVPLAYLEPDSMNLNAGKAALEILDANKHISQVCAVWRLIHHMLPSLTENPYSKALVIGNPTSTQWMENRLRGANPEAWDLVIIGVKLSLGTSTQEVAARFQSLEQAAVQYDAEALEAEKWGHGGQAARIAGNKGALGNLAHNLAQANAS
ncbi:hypothetical protein [Arthrobacter sp. H5]|uniref:hypothetical protein n=1 Tax=Arthrobacter sp. H5 TaxID=1267973 RepID=UPI000486C85B|nr:hypothetical protein [Arthrobacter sp. H5]